MTFSLKFTSCAIVALSTIGLPSIYGQETISRQVDASSATTKELETHFHAGWDSRYLSEGRDALDGDSLWSSSFEFSWDQLSAGIWYGNSPEQTYDEVQLALALTKNIGDFEVYGGYTHLRFPFENTYDNEIGVGFAWSELPFGCTLGADTYYSFDAEGVFAEVFVAWEAEITDQLSIGLSSVLGINEGYVSDGHDGANHIAVGLESAYALTDSISLIAHATYSWALARDSTLAGDEQLVDFFHGGLGLQWSF